MKPKDILIFKELLHEHKYRVTPARIALLMLLRNSKKPLTVNDIQKETTHKMDKVTLYRALEDFLKSKIVGKIKLQNTATYYEFLDKDHHHHHIVCENCGGIEDIEHCGQTNLQKEVLRTSKNFSIINSHSLEFFGLCKACNKK
jgi:Fur family ferric uptake transcriptional regulator